MMETAKHTPGPWRLDDAESIQDSSVLGPDGELVVAGEYDGWMVPFACRGAEEGAANARLIVNAPRMVEALRALVTEADRTGGNERIVSRYEVDRARAILREIDEGGTA